MYYSWVQLLWQYNVIILWAHSPWDKFLYCYLRNTSVLEVQVILAKFLPKQLPSKLKIKMFCIRDLTMLVSVILYTQWYTPFHNTHGLTPFIVSRISWSSLLIEAFMKWSDLHLEYLTFHGILYPLPMWYFVLNLQCSQVQWVNHASFTITELSNSQN